MQYIDKNLKRIIENPDSVLYLKPYDVGNKQALFAVVKEREGVYEKVQITKEVSKVHFPFEPIYWFHNGPGYFFLQNFISIYNWYALNTTNLDGFKYKNLEEHKMENIGIYAAFSDGSALFIHRERNKKFIKQGGIDKYNDLLRQYKECNFQHETYRVIDYYFGNKNVCMIPELLGPTNLEFKEIDYQDLAYKDEDGNAIESEFISSKQAQEAVKQLSKIRNRYNK